MQNLVIFSVFVTDLSEGPEGLLINSEDTSKTGEAVSILEHSVGFQNGSDKLEKLSGECRMQFKRKFASVLCLDCNNQLWKCRTEEATG